MDNVSHETSPQRTRQWYIDRMGKVTGSNMHRALMGPRGRATYIRELIYERELLAEGGQDLDAYINEMMSIDTPAMAWGRKHESYSLARLEMLLNVDIREIGFRIHPNHPNIGCSVDGIMSQYAVTPPKNTQPAQLQIVEAKNPYNPSVHLTNYLMNGVENYKPQIQGNIWVMCAAGCHFVSFDPRASLELQFFTQYIPRDEEYLLHTLAPAVLHILACVESKTVPEQPGSIPNLF